MFQDLFPDPDPDPEPGDPESGGFPPDQDAPGTEQGLYITLPAGQLQALSRHFRPRGRSAAGREAP